MNSINNKSKIIFLAVTFISCSNGFASEQLETWSTRNPVSFWIDRAKEDWRYVDNLDDNQKTLSEKLKRIDITDSGDFKYSFNGTYRIHFVNRWNQNFVEGDRQKDEYLSRIFLGSELNYKDRARVYGELRINNTNFTDNSPVDDGGTDIHQLFLEYSNSNLFDKDWTVKLGRQEFLLTRMQFGNRELSGVQASWDAISTRFYVSDVEIGAYWGEEVLPVYKDGSWAGNFDDKGTGNKSKGIYGIVAGDYGQLTGYVLDTKIYNWSFIHANPGWENITSLGLNAFKYTRSGFGYSGDLIYQFGDQEGKNVSAYMGFGTINYNWDLDWKWQLGMVGHYASGTKSDDSSLHTFNPLWTDDILDAANTAAYSNVIQGGPYLSVDYAPAQTVYFGFMSTWRVSKDDAIYTKDQSLLYGADSDEKYAYTQAAIRFHNLITTNLKFDAALLYAFDSKYLEDVIDSKVADSRRWDMQITYNF
ncbi:alginate export family protein [Vibrio spartinae]|uniref:Uncharacterized protein n=1 Tax=Vibrio spartinae TaxID=1918945 RepID=A0A1N6MB33_9VIBR|nr:alginate export family protein [Vibrio spartinae]QMV13795.1 hypothetical protein Vspart_01037 [Vibrio spartinae]SIO96567.1 hypothetical protein VSP9026_04370 [Vibrio spartinae]